jgi:hypothetical protein
MSCISNKPSLTCSQEKQIYLSRILWELKPSLAQHAPLFTVSLSPHPYISIMKKQKSIVINGLDSIDEPDPQPL